MIIASKNIPALVKSLKFPVKVLAEKGNEVALLVYEADLLNLADLDAIVAVGSWKSIRHFRLSRPLDASVNLRIKGGNSTACISSVYLDDSPTHIMKRAVGTRQNYTLEKVQGIPRSLVHANA